VSINIADAILSLIPGVNVSVIGNSVENIIWHDEVENIPTNQEILDELERLTLLESELAEDAAAAKESAKLKLSNLGLTEKEIKSLIGGL
jgi:hypothetical protein